MKILIVIPYFYPSIGGLQNYALHISKGLQQLGHEVIVITTNHEEKKYKVETVHSLKVYRLPIDYTISNTPLGFRWLSEIQKIVATEQPDVINAHTPVPFISDIAAIVAKKNNIPYILTYQNDLMKDNFLLNVVIQLYYFLMGIPTLKKSTKIIASSQYYANNSKYLKKYKDKIEIVSPGVDLQHFSDKNLHKNKYNDLQNKYKNKKVLLFIGQLDKTHAHKGLAYLIHALSLIKANEEKVHLIIAGKGNYSNYYKKLVVTLKLENHVTFAGFVSDTDLPYLYNLSEVIVLPSYNRSEGFGMVLIEAGASSKPVVASNVGGIPYVVQDKKTGFLVEPKAIHELSSSLQILLQDKVLSKKLGNNNYKWVKDNFTWDKQIEKTNTIFTNLFL